MSDNTGIGTATGEINPALGNTPRAADGTLTHDQIMRNAELNAPPGSTVAANSKPAPAGEVEQHLATHDDRLARLEAIVDRLTPLLDTGAQIGEAAFPKDAGTIEATRRTVHDILAAWKTHFGWSVPALPAPTDQEQLAASSTRLGVFDATVERPGVDPDPRFDRDGNRILADFPSPTPARFDPATGTRIS